MGFINGNTLTAIGKQCVYTTDIMFNVSTISAYSASISGTSGTSIGVKQEYRFSTDGVVFTDYYDASLLSSPSLPFNQKNILIIEVRFTRIGTSNSGLVSINSVLITTNQFPTLLKYPIGSKTHLSQYLNNNPDVEALVVNLSQKMYDRGVMPSFIERNEQNFNLDVDKDYINLWQSVSKIFAIIYVYGSQFKNIYNIQELLCEYLKQKTIQVCDCSEMELLQSLAKNFFDEIRQRGTIEVFRPKDYEYPIGYRNKYNCSLFGTILSECPVYIDDVLYFDTTRLPFGWIWDGGTGHLTAPDLNYHQIQLPDKGSYSGIPVTDSDYLIFDTFPRIDIGVLIQLDPTHSSGIRRKYHGEYLRMICYNQDCDEFMFNLVNPNHMGWNIGNSSPLWKGLRQHQNNSIIKGYESFSEDVWDLSYYPIIGSGIATEQFLIKHDSAANDLLKYDTASNTYIKYI